MTLIYGDPNPVHLRLVAAVAKHKEESLAGIDGEHPEEGADLRLDPEQVVEDEIIRDFAVHVME
jgi:hypothetical protein